MYRASIASPAMIATRLIAAMVIAWVGVPNSDVFAQTARSWIGPAGGNWFTAANWSPNGAPAPADFLTLGSGDNPVTASTVDISFGGTLHMTNATAAVGNLLVGSTADGTLTMVNSSTLSSAHVQIGSNTNGDGYAAIAGSTAQWNIAGQLVVANSGRGDLDISAGANVIVTTTAFFGASVTADGSATVRGDGSLLDISSTLFLGNNGVGTLNIAHNAVVENNSAFIGSNSGSSGQVIIDTGGLWTSSSDVILGDSGFGSLDIRGGGQATSISAIVGSGSTGFGRVHVDGADSLWDIASTLFVGNSGAAELDIFDGGRVENDTGTIGANGNGRGEVTVRNGGTWVNTGLLTVGRAGEGSLLILEGGSVNSASSEIGTFAGSVGRVVVDGENSVWDTDGPLVIGNLGTAELLISHGGLVRSDGGSIGESSEMNIVGVGSGFGAGINTTFQVNGRLNVTDGANASGSHVIAGDPAGLLGVISIWDEGSLFQARDLTIDSGSMLVDFGARARVTQQTALLNDGVLILDGGEFTTADLDATDGEFALFSGTMTIDGGTFLPPTGPLELGITSDELTVNFVDGAIDNTDVLVIADTGKATVNYSEGSTHTSGSGTTIGKEAGSQGTLNVSGAGTQFTPSGYIELARFGAGTLNAWDGAIVAAEDFYIGSSPSARGVLNLSGAGTTLNVITGNATLELGNGEMHVSNEAAANVDTLWVGANSGSHGVVTVDGGGVLNVTDALRVGSNLSTAQVTILNGGIVNAENTQVFPGSKLVLDGGILTFLGDEANVSPNGTFEFKAGVLNVETSSFFESVSPLLVPSAGVVNVHADIVATVTSLPGSKINITGNGLEIGRANEFLGVQLAGELHISDKQISLLSAGFAQLGALTTMAGGVLTAPKGIALGTGDVLTGFGEVNGKVAAGIGSLIQANGEDLNLGDITRSDGFATDGNLEVGTHSVELMDANQATLGSLTMLGNTTTPGTLVGSNGLIVDFGRNVEGYGTVDTPDDPLRPSIVNGGVAGDSATNRLTFTGHVKGVGTFDNVIFTGTHAPGFSPATVNYGSVAYDGTLEIELAGVLTGSFDKIIHSGVAELGGVLDVSLINGFVPAVGNMFEIITAVGGVSGMFETELLPTLGSGLDWDISYGANNVVLSVVTAGLPGDFDVDGDVDGRDFLIWQRGNSPNPLSAGDLAAWQANYGLGSLATAGVSVPEPDAIGIIFATAAWLLRFRNRLR